MTRRKWIATGILGLWLGGLGLLTRRELFPDEEKRREQAAQLVEPLSLYYAIEEAGSHIGYATLQIDTSLLGIVVKRQIQTHVRGDSGPDRVSLDFTAQLSQRLRLVEYSQVFDSAGTRRTMRARTVGDSLAELQGDSRVSRPEGGFIFSDAFTDTVVMARSAIVPEVAPLLLALGRNLKVGSEYALEVFDREARATEVKSLRIEAESVFVAADSAAWDSTAALFVAARQDTVRAWRVTLDGPSGGQVWSDRSGRVVLQRLPDGRSLRRTAFELAFENWRLTRDTMHVVALPNRSPTAAVFTETAPEPS